MTAGLLVSQTEPAQLGSYLYLKGIRNPSAPSKLPNQSYSDPASAPVVIGALKVTKVSLYSIYSDPASAQVVIGALKVTKWVPKVSLFTVTPLLGFPKYRY